MGAGSVGGVINVNVFRWAGAANSLGNVTTPAGAIIRANTWLETAAAKKAVGVGEKEKK